MTKLGKFAAACAAVLCGYGAFGEVALLGMEAELVRTSSVFGSSEVSATVTGIGEAASATITFKYGSTRDSMDTTLPVVAVSEPGAYGVWIPRLMTDQTCYVQATLANGTDAPVTSEVFELVQPRVIEPGDATSADYLKTGLVGQWDGVDNVIVGGVRTHSNEPDKWYDLSGNGYDATFSNPSKLAWENDGWTNDQDSRPAYLPLDVNPALNDKEFTVEFFVEPSRDTSRQVFFGQYGGVFNIEHRTDGGTRVYFGGNPDIGVSAVKIPKDVKTAFTYTTKDGVHRMYLNGVEVWNKTQAIVKAPDTAKQFVIGGENNRANMSFRGKWHSLRVYDQAISADEVAVNYAVDAVRFSGAGSILLPLELSGDKLAVTVPAAEADRTAYLYAGENYGGVDGWGAAVASATIAAGETSAEFALPNGWGESLYFARVKVGEVGSAQWSNTVIWQDTNIPAITLGELDGTGGDTLVVKGTVDSLGGDSCTLKVYTGTSEDAVTEEWADLDGSTVTDTGDFALTLFEKDKSSPRYLAPDETRFVRISAKGANGKAAMSAIQEVKMAGAATFGTVATPTYDKRTMTVKAQMADLGMCGETAVELWVGAKASSLQKVAGPVVVTNANQDFSLSYELPLYETTYVRQLRATNVSAGKTAEVVASTTVANVSAPDSATYTWTNGSGDGKWSTAANWTDNKDGDSLGWPQTVSATAKFTANATVDVNVASVQVKTLDFNVANIDITFVSSTDGGDYNLKTGLSWPGQNGRCTFDGIRITTGTAIQPRTASTIALANGAEMTVTANISPTSQDGQILLSGDSTLTVKGVYPGNNLKIVIEDSTFITTENEQFGYRVGESSVVFKGTHPKWRHTMANNKFWEKPEKAGIVSSTHFDFLVPVGGYESAPIEATVMTSELMMNGSDSPITFNILPDSPASRVDATVTTELVCWPKGIVKEWIGFGTLPTEAAGCAFAWGEGDAPTNLSVTVVGSTHQDRLSIAGDPAVVPDEDDGISPKFGNVDGESSVALKVPVSFVFADGLRRAVCTGWKLYDVDPATQVPGAEPVKSGTENTYVWTSENKWQKFVWQWRIEGKVDLSAGEGGTAAADAEWTREGSAVTLTATPSEGYAFGWWTGDLPDGCDIFNPVQKITLTGVAKSVVAHFRKFVYLSKDGDDANGGTSWNDAVASLPVALAKAEAPQVMVGPGLYETNDYIQIDKPAVIAGQKTEKGTESVFKLTAARGAVFVLANPLSRLENLAMTTADQAYGRGVLLRGGGTVDGCVITNCYCDQSKPVLGNDAPNDGGGVLLLNGGTVRNTYFYQCAPFSSTGDYRGGGIAIFGEGLAENCDIHDCYALRQGGGGVYLKGGGTLRNSLIRGCYMTSAQDSTGVSMTDGSVENCTIVGCHMDSSAYASAVTISGGTIVNSIIWGNVNGGGVAGVKQTGGTISHCTHEMPLEGEGNVTVDPVFVDPAEGNYMLTLTDCVDAGTELSWHEGAKDLKGDSRVMGEAVDLGCYEFKSDGLVASIGYESDGRNDNAVVTFTATVMGAKEPTQTYAWHVTSAQGYDKTQSGEGLSSLALTLPTGEYAVALTVTDGGVSVDAIPVGGIRVKASHTYVAKDGKALAPYTSSENATSNLQEAVNFTGPGGVVHVADGFYTMDDTLMLDSDVRVKGDHGPDAVTLFAEPVVDGFPIVFFAHPDAVLDGVTLSGYSEDGQRPKIRCAVQLREQGGTVTNCVIDGVSYGTSGSGGVGVQMANGLVVDTIVRNCWVESWNSPRRGIGISMTGGLVDSCVISNNVTRENNGSHGGGVCLTGGTLRNSKICFNECSGFGGGVYNTKGKVVNCLIYGNKAWGSGTGVYQDGTGSLVNLTVAGNVTNTAEVAAACHVVGKATVKNCIIWGNDGVTQQLSDPPSGSTMGNNFTADPKFRNPARGNYRLLSSSPCIDAGDDDVLSDLDMALDLNQQPRKQGKHVDIGCYEGARRGLVLFFY